MKRFALLLSTLVAIAVPSAARADNARFTFLKTIPVADLNRILDSDRETFIHDEVPGAGPGYLKPPASKATNAVDIYTVVYETHIPERGNETATVSGMLALPHLAKRSTIPLMSYQRGTVYHKYAVPSYAFQAKSPWSYPHQREAYETRYMTALFAGNGYGLVAADYVGFGRDAKSDEAYLIKGLPPKRAWISLTMQPIFWQPRPSFLPVSSYRVGRRAGITPAPFSKVSKEKASR